MHLWSNWPGGGGDRDFPWHVARMNGCWRVGEIWPNFGFRGGAVSNVDDALVIGKGVNVTGESNVGNQHQSQRDYYAFSPGHIVAHTCQEICLKPKRNPNEGNIIFLYPAGIN
jgi:hypothetical protein